jgi:hypothetical protein
MAYIGKTPVIGNFVKLDAITAVNGQAAYTMQNGGSNFTDYESVNQFLVSLNGTIQAPTDSFTVSGSTLTFASNLATGDVIDFIMVFGNSLSAGTPTDATVSTAKIVDANVTTAKLAGDAVTEAKIADSAVENEHLNVNVITGQTAETSIATDDTILIHDTSASALRKMTRANFVSGLGGMVLLDTQSVTSGTIANIQTGAIFSDTYNSYRIMFDQFKFSEPSALYFQLATSSGVVTGYQRNTIGLRGSNNQDTYSSSDSSIKLFGDDSSNDYKSNSNQGMPSGYIDVFNPYTAGNTHILSKLNFGNATDNAAQQAHTLAIKIDTTSYDRFKIGLSNGSIGATTKVRTYGFNI